MAVLRREAMGFTAPCADSAHPPGDSGSWRVLLNMERDDDDTKNDPVSKALPFLTNAKTHRESDPDEKCFT